MFSMHLLHDQTQTRYLPGTIYNPYYQLIFIPLIICSAPFVCQLLDQTLGICYLQPHNSLLSKIILISIFLNQKLKFGENDKPMQSSHTLEQVGSSGFFGIEPGQYSLLLHICSISCYLSHALYYFTSRISLRILNVGSS